MATSPELLELGARLSNWGRWGEDDQLGTGNLLTADSLRRGADAIRSGERVSLGVPLVKKGIQVGQPAGRYNAMLSFTSLNERDQMAPGVWLGCDDLFTMSSCAGTHIDALSHVSYDEKLYNGRPITTITANHGARWCGAEQLPDIVTRAVLIDVPLLRGEDRLAPATAVTVEDLQAGYDHAGVEPEAGDAVLIRTAEIAYYFDGERERYAVGDQWRMTGLGITCAEWFHRHDIAAAFIDTYAYEVMPPESGNWDDMLAVHMVQLRDMGMIQGQNWNFEDLARRCADHAQYTMMLSAQPLAVVGATSAPVQPLAIL